MCNNSILGRRFNGHEQKRLGYGAVICFFIMALFFCTFFKPYLNPLPPLNLQNSMGVGLKMLAVKATNSSQQMIVVKSALHENYCWQKQEPRNVTTNFQEENSTALLSKNVKEVETKKIHSVPLCKTDEERTEFCEIKTVARVDAKLFSIIIASSSRMDRHSTEEGDTCLSTTIRPYARKEDPIAMSKVSRWSVLLIKAAEGLEKIPRCTQNHSVPAVLFSLGGYAGNNFHDFSDIVIPLFITSRRYNGEVQFLITDYKSIFVEKFQKVLKGLSRYEAIAIDEEDQQVHCFPSVTIGLKRDLREMSIDPEKHSTSMIEFREFLRNTYSLERVKAITIKDNLPRKKPRLLIISRQKTRVFTNIGDIMAMARGLGYKVSVAEADSNLERFSEAVNSCDVLMGVHGAGLANIVFLPENAVFIQIIPIGGLEWLAQTDFELPSKDMNLNYLEYKISKEESTLIEQYPIDHTVFTDPPSINNQQGWISFRSIYLDKQNVNLNVRRFRPTLVKALQLLHVHH